MKRIQKIAKKAILLTSFLIFLGESCGFERINAGKERKKIGVQKNKKKSSKRRNSKKKWYWFIKGKRKMDRKRREEMMKKGGFLGREEVKDMGDTSKGNQQKEGRDNEGKIDESKSNGGTSQGLMTSEIKNDKGAVVDMSRTTTNSSSKQIDELKRKSDNLVDQEKKINELEDKLKQKEKRLGEESGKLKNMQGEIAQLSEKLKQEKKGNVALQQKNVVLKQEEGKWEIERAELEKKMSDMRKEEGDLNRAIKELQREIEIKNKNITEKQTKIDQIENDKTMLEEKKNDEIGNLQAQIERLKVERDEEKQNLEKAGEVLNNMHREITLLSEQLGQERKEKDLLRQEKDTLQQEKDTLQQEKDTLQQEKDTLQQGNDDLQQRNDDLQQEIQKRREEEKISQKSITELETEIARLKGEIETIEKQKEDAEVAFKSQLEKMTMDQSKEMNSLTIDLNKIEAALKMKEVEMSDEVERLKQRIAQLEELTEFEETENQRKQGQIVSLQEKIQSQNEDLGLIRGKLNGLQVEQEKKLNEVNSQKFKLQQILEIKEMNLNSKKEEIVRNANEIKNLKDKNNGLEKDKNDLTDKIVSIEQRERDKEMNYNLEVAKLMVQLQTVETELEQVKGNIKEKETVLNGLNEKVLVLESQLTTEKKEKDEIKKMLETKDQDAEVLKTNLHEKTIEFQELEEKFKDLNISNQQTKQSLAEREGELKNSQEANAELKRTVEELKKEMENEKNTITTLVKERDELKIVKGRLEVEIETKEKQLKTLEGEKSGLEKESDGLSRRNRMLDERIISLEIYQQTTKSEILETRKYNTKEKRDEFNRVKDELEEVKNEKEKMKLRIEAQISKNDLLKDQLEKLKNDLTKATLELSSKDTQIKNHEVMIKTMDEQRKEIEKVMITREIVRTNQQTQTDVPKSEDKATEIEYQNIDIGVQTDRGQGKNMDTQTVLSRQDIQSDRGDKTDFGTQTITNNNEDIREGLEKKIKNEYKTSFDRIIKGINGVDIAEKKKRELMDSFKNNRVGEIEGRKASIDKIITSKEEFLGDRIKERAEKKVSSELINLRISEIDRIYSLCWEDWERIGEANWIAQKKTIKKESINSIEQLTNKMSETYDKCFEELAKIIRKEDEEEKIKYKELANKYSKIFKRWFEETKKNEEEGQKKQMRIININELTDKLNILETKANKSEVNVKNTEGEDTKETWAEFERSVYKEIKDHVQERKDEVEQIKKELNNLSPMDNEIGAEIDTNKNRGEITESEQEEIEQGWKIEREFKELMKWNQEFNFLMLKIEELEKQGTKVKLKVHGINNRMNSLKNELSKVREKLNDLKGNWDAKTRDDKTGKIILERIDMIINNKITNKTEKKENEEESKERTENNEWDYLKRTADKDLEVFKVDFELKGNETLKIIGEVDTDRENEDYSEIEQLDKMEYIERYKKEGVVFCKKIENEFNEIWRRLGEETKKKLNEQQIKESITKFKNFKMKLKTLNIKHDIKNSIRDENLTVTTKKKTINSQIDKFEEGIRKLERQFENIIKNPNEEEFTKTNKEAKQKKQIHNNQQMMNKRDDRDNNKKKHLILDNDEIIKRCTNILIQVTQNKVKIIEQLIRKMLEKDTEVTKKETDFQSRSEKKDKIQKNKDNEYTIINEKIKTLISKSENLIKLNDDKLNELIVIKDDIEKLMEKQWDKGEMTRIDKLREENFKVSSSAKKRRTDKTGSFNNEFSSNKKQTFTVKTGGDQLIVQENNGGQKNARSLIIPQTTLLSNFERGLTQAPKELRVKKRYE